MSWQRIIIRITLLIVHQILNMIASPGKSRLYGLWWIESRKIPSIILKIIFNVSINATKIINYRVILQSIGQSSNFKEGTIKKTDTILREFGIFNI